MNYTIGAPIIVKDEIRCIDRCLMSLVGHMDQIVVMDTGSTDGTLERLRIWEACYPEIKVVEEPWDGSFSSMRNKVQALMETDFLFIIDADEWLPIPNRGSAKNPWSLIERCIQEQGAVLDCAYIYVYNHLPSKQIAVGDQAPSIRIIHNNPYFKWEGSVHNQIQRSIAKNCRNGDKVKLSYIDVVLEHDGYNLDKKVAIDKYTRRLPLMLEEIEKNKAVGNTSLEAYYRFQLGVGQYICGLLEDARDTFTELNFDTLENHNKYNAANIAVSTAILLNDENNMLLWSDKQMELAPTQPIVLLNRATTFYKLERHEDAYPLAVAAIVLNQDPTIDKTHTLDEAYCAGLAAELAYHLGLLNEAVIFARFCLGTYPQHIRMQEINKEGTRFIRKSLMATAGKEEDIREIGL